MTSRTEVQSTPRASDKIGIASPSMTAMNLGMSLQLEATCAPSKSFLKTSPPSPSLFSPFFVFLSIFTNYYFCFFCFFFIYHFCLFSFHNRSRETDLLCTRSSSQGRRKSSPQTPKSSHQLSLLRLLRSVNGDPLLTRCEWKPCVFRV